MLVMCNFVEDLVDFLDDQIFPNLLCHALGETFLTHRHRGC